MISVARGKRTPFSGSEEVECALSTTSNRGCQIVVEGFGLENATVTVTYPHSEATEELGAVEGADVASIVVGEGMLLSKIRISEPSGGEKFVTFLQI